MATGTQNPQTEGLALEPIGQMTGDCQKLLLAGPLESMRATQSNDYGVKSMTYLRNGRKKTFGNSGERIVEWTLT